MDGAVTEIVNDTIVLWQDFTHPNGYRPRLEMMVFPDGKMALKLSVFGKVTVVPYTKAECEHV
jgi:hypothetical protein